MGADPGGQLFVYGSGRIRIRKIALILLSHSGVRRPAWAHEEGPPADGDHLPALWKPVQQEVYTQPAHRAGTVGVQTL